MASLIFKHHPLFHIQRLTETTAQSVDDIEDETVEIYLVLAGKVIINGNGFRILLEDNNLYCFCDSENIQVEIKPGTAGYAVRFSKQLLFSDNYELHSSDLSTFHALILRGEIVQVNASFLKEGKKICEMMYHEFRYHNDFRTQILNGLLGIFLLHLIRRSNLFMYISDRKTQHTLVRRFNALLEQEFKTLKRVSQYATMLSVTPNHLNETIKRITGKSAGSHIRQRVALEAVRQARLRGASLKEVAYELGFNDNAHFSKFFKKVAGMNYSDIRRLHYTDPPSLSAEIDTLLPFH